MIAENSLSLFTLLKEGRERLIASSALHRSDQGTAALGKLFFGFDPLSLREERETLIGKIAYLFINRAILIRILEDAGFCQGLPGDSRERAIALDEISRFVPPESLPLFEPHLPFGKIFPLAERAALLEILSRHSFEGFEKLRFLGDLFERFLDPSERSYLGQFYTSQRIVDFILDEMFEKFDQSEDEADLTSLRLLDPACGSGHFLHEAYRRFFKKYEAKHPELAPSEIHRRILRHNLWGMDLNPLAVQLAKIGLVLLGLEHGCFEPPHLLNTDALFLHGHSQSGKGEKISNKIREVKELTYSFAGHSPEEVERFFSGPFDWVLGNPPYGATLSPSDRAYYGEHYDAAVGRYDTVGLFVERGLQLLKKGGKLGFVIPHAFSRSGAYQPARDLILRDGRLVLMANALSAFEDVNLNTMILGVEKTNEAGITRLFDENREGFTLIGEAPSEFYLDRPVFPLFLTTSSFRLLQRMEESGCCRLREFARIRRGSSISNRDPALSPHRPELLPVIRGRDLKQKFWDLRDHPVLGIDPSGRKPLEQDVPGFQNIASRFQATLFPAGFLPLDTTNYLEVVDPENARYAKWLIALLNSETLHVYLSNFLLNRATMTVHLDAPTIGDIPIVLPPPEDLKMVDLLVDAALAGKKTLEVLESMVIRAYGLG